MFDMGFLELLMIGVIALLVFGPDKLPGVARSAGLWIGRMKRFLGTVKADIDKELRLQELQEQMQQSEAKNSVYEFLNETRNTLNQKIGPEDASKPNSTRINESPSANAPPSDPPAPAIEQKPSYSAVSSAPPAASPPPATETVTAPSDTQPTDSHPR
jgi:sec-independent protein translocase protein TatB